MLIVTSLRTAAGLSGRERSSCLTIKENQMTFKLPQVCLERKGWQPNCFAALLLSCIVLLLCVPSLRAQLTTGSLSGTVTDTSGAVVPNAKVILLNEGNGDQRQTVSNSAGRFTFAAVLRGTYTVTISAGGFEMWKQTGITMNAGDTREV